MKLTYKSSNGVRAIVKIGGKLVNDGNGNGTVELTSAEAIKLALAFRHSALAIDTAFCTANPVALDKDAEEMLTVTAFAVKVNGGPVVGMKTRTFAATPSAFTLSVEDANRCIEIVEPGANAKPAPDANGGAPAEATPSPVKKSAKKQPKAAEGGAE